MKPITDINQLDLNGYYTYADYLTWRFKQRVELIKGRIFKMSPAPNLKHQRISGELHRQIANFLHLKTCQVFHAPFDVRLPLPEIKQKKGKTDTVVQPDITVVCDEKKLDKQGCIGVPDLVIEILSPGNTKREMKDKFEIYQHAGIPEYWVVEPDHEYVLVYRLDKKGKYIGDVPYTDEDTIKSVALKRFKFELSSIFGQSGK